MKVLLIGMDGVNIETFQRGWTPYISTLIEKGNKIEIKNDLLSRGWIEIVTGRHARETGAMYDKPKSNATIDWNLEFNLNDTYKVKKNINPIWQVLSDHNYKVGVMNVPAVYPAPEVNGFFVSGGGGGAKVEKLASTSHCYPKKIAKILNSQSYVVDQRFSQLYIEKKIKTVGEIFQIMENKNKKRTKSFIYLATKFEVDFGLIIYKTSSVMAETMVIPEFNRMQNNKKKIDKGFLSTIEKYYNNFDNEIKKLHKSFPEAEIIFTSDHGMVERKYSINPNIFLQDFGFQIVDRRKGILKKISQHIKLLIPYKARQYLKKTVLKKYNYISKPDFNSESTVAFSVSNGDWNHGIYLNDKVRFGGIVNEENFQEIKNKIVKEFNNSQESKNHNLVAHCEERKSDYFPDIVIDAPDGYLITNMGAKFVSLYKSDQERSGLKGMIKGEISCIKSKTPLAVNAFNPWILKSSDDKDLTLIYRHILRTFLGKDSL